MIPAWTTAPAWATHTAMDADGAWHWFDCDPQYLRGHWEPSMLGGRVQCWSPAPASETSQARPEVAP